ncbi:unnamed protein product [Heterotrigona itama]|uniref:Mos1 transposase HTH domain-containing protein n=1 Tax=Heterotrigona itama TaxID=395501 RepID=A0A6V7H621_9HYME|nr:unnamed protein product [Heterotrigona itama]
MGKKFLNRLTLRANSDFMALDAWLSILRDFRQDLIYHSCSNSVGRNNQMIKPTVNIIRNINIMMQLIRFVYSVGKCWFSRFRSGDFSLSDVPASGRPTEVVDNDEHGSLIESNPRQTVQDLANRLGASLSTIQEHLHNKQENCTGRNC